MRIALFGSTGGLGRAVLAEALSRGLPVRAHARSPGKLAALQTPATAPDAPASALEVVQGDLDDAASVAATVEGVDAVVSCAGLTGKQDPEVFGRGMAHVVDAMQAHGVRRVVAISGAGLELDGDLTGLGRRLIITALQAFAGPVLRGKQLEWQAISGADLDWTLVRVARMVDRPAAGSVKVDGRQVAGSPMVAYPDVAAWMLDQLDDPTWVRQAPFVSGG